MPATFRFSQVVNMFGKKLLLEPCGPTLACIAKRPDPHIQGYLVVVHTSSRYFFVLIATFLFVFEDHEKVKLHGCIFIEQATFKAISEKHITFTTAGNTVWTLESEGAPETLSAEIWLAALKQHSDLEKLGATEVMLERFEDAQYQIKALKAENERMKLCLDEYSQASTKIRCFRDSMKLENTSLKRKVMSKEQESLEREKELERTRKDLQHAKKRIIELQDFQYIERRRRQTKDSRAFMCGFF